MGFKSTGRKYREVHLSPWIIVGAAVILLVIVVVLAARNYNREKHYMSEILSEKGAALIKAFEAGARTGMMHMRWRSDQVQTLLEQTAQQSDIHYLMVTDPSGVVLAHSDGARIGEKMDRGLFHGLSPGEKERWRIVAREKGRRTFEIYRYFHPLRGRRWDPGNGCPSPQGRAGFGRGRSAGWCFPDRSGEDEQIIFVGLAVAPFEDARKEDIRNTFIISSVLLLLGLAGFVSLFQAHNYRITKRLLQDTSAFADEVVANLPVGLVATDSQGKIAFFNASAEHITGARSESVKEKPLQRVFPAFWSDLEPALGKRTILEEEMQGVFEGSKRVPLSVSAAEIVNEEGHFVGRIFILRDLGEVRRLQAEIRRKEKLAALGGLAAGVAHEIRNPLSSIKGLASYFGNKFEVSDEDREAAEVMVREVERVNRVVSELLDFARPSELNLKRVDLKGVLEHSLRLVRRDAETRKIRIHLAAGEDLTPVLLDADRFSQCLLNLYLNAIQAMGEGGLLSVRGESGGNGTVRVEVEDTGQGINPEDVGKIFDPYYTTKPSGTGLGLAIVHKIVEAHHGRIDVQSRKGKGVCFTLHLPVDAQKEERA